MLTGNTVIILSLKWMLINAHECYYMTLTWTLQSHSAYALQGILLYSFISRSRPEHIVPVDITHTLWCRKMGPTWMVRDNCTYRLHIFHLHIVYSQLVQIGTTIILQENCIIFRGVRHNAYQTVLLVYARYELSETCIQIYSFHHVQLKTYCRML